MKLKRFLSPAKHLAILMWLVNLYTCVRNYTYMCSDYTGAFNWAHKTPLYANCLVLIVLCDR